MNFWIYRDNRQQGPFGYEELEHMGLTPQTPVWYEGLAKWLPAGEAPLTRPLFAGSGEAASADRSSEYTGYTEVTDSSEYSGNRRNPENPENSENSEPAEPARVAGTSRWSGWLKGGQRAAEPTSPGQAVAEPHNLFWAIFTTLCCCLPLGIVSIIMSAQSRSRAKAGDIAGANRYSEISAWLIMVSFALGMITMPLSMIMYM